MLRAGRYIPSNTLRSSLVELGESHADALHGELCKRVDVLALELGEDRKC